MYGVFGSHCIFYKYIFKLNYGYDVELNYIGNKTTFDPNKYYIYYQHSLTSYLNSHYEYEVINEWKDMKLIKVKKIFENKPVL